MLLDSFAHPSTTLTLPLATVVNLATKVAQWPLFAREMCDRFGYDRIIGMVSGTEAADAAIKFGRKWGIKTKGINPREALILGASDNYHGMGSGIWPIMNDMGQESGLSSPSTCNGSGSGRR